MNTTTVLSEEEDLRLAEYTLGVLDADERKAVQELLASKLEYTQRVAEWHAYLAPMLEEIADESPPDYVWTRIRDGLGHRLAPQQAVSQASSRAVGTWDNLRLWRFFAAAGLAASLILAVLLVVMLPGQEGEPPAQSMLTAALELENGQVVYTATVDADRRILIVVPAAEVELEGRDAELWLIAGDLPPQSLGVLPADGAVRLVLPEELVALASADSVFAVSLEPLGGSPTGLPTGPVVAQGVLAGI
ncbi:MAG: anti-sigma factor [Pseudomonas sp.]|uniref:anti-sigma factor n=1 Tax=Halopseudomonas laoshanensis TaxID=2268758 RepID=UPI001B6735FA|nr:anti-sigma factor [Pseudomonas sp.]|tara:strand:- start:731 stop:1471 length:741 start_codon:yes stop_codon:yes gene_type:complete